MADLALKDLDEDDIRNLVRHPNPEKRAIAAQKICRTIRDKKLSRAERALAQGLLQYMAKDAVELVRRALAVTLKNSPDLPRMIALQLASDIDSIAIPIIESSPVFTDSDLIEVLRSKAAAKVIAVAKRPKVSGSLVNAIVRYGDSHAVAEVAANDGAEIDRETAELILDVYHDDDLIKDAIISRRDLPATIMEKLITQVSEEAAVILSRNYSLTAGQAIGLASRARERATLEVASDAGTEKDMSAFAAHLKSEGRLTMSYLLRAIGLGKIDVVKFGLAELASISPGRAELMLYDSGPFGLHALCRQAGLSDLHTRIIRAGIAIFKDLEITGIEYDEVYFQTLMTERLLTLPLEIDEADRNWLLERLDALDEQAA